MKNNYLEIRKRLGTNITNLVHDRKINRKKFCVDAHVARSTLNRIEDHDETNISFRTLISLANALEISLERLLFNEFRPSLVERSTKGSK